MVLYTLKKYLHAAKLQSPDKVVQVYRQEFALPVIEVMSFRTAALAAVPGSQWAEVVHRAPCQGSCDCMAAWSESTLMWKAILQSPPPARTCASSSSSSGS